VSNRLTKFFRFIFTDDSGVIEFLQAYKASGEEIPQLDESIFDLVNARLDHFMVSSHDKGGLSGRIPCHSCLEKFRCGLSLNAFCAAIVEKCSLSPKTKMDKHHKAKHCNKEINDDEI
jgi:hypothetical protein